MGLGRTVLKDQKDLVLQASIGRYFECWAGIWRAGWEGAGERLNLTSVS